MNDKLKPELMKLLDITDEKVADKVLQYAMLVNDGTATNLVNSDKKKKAQELLNNLRANDFAVAKELNESVSKIVSLVADNIRKANNYSLTDTSAINRSYVLMVNELQRIYDRNIELSSISYSPVWREIELIDSNAELINDYVWERQNGSGQMHTAQVAKLAIIAGKDKADLTDKQKSIVNEADKAIADFSEEVYENINKNSSKKVNNFFLDYKTSKDWFKDCSQCIAWKNF